MVEVFLVEYPLLFKNNTSFKKLNLNPINEVEFKHILSTFSIVEERMKEKTLKTFLANNYPHIN